MKSILCLVRGALRSSTIATACALASLSNPVSAFDGPPRGLEQADGLIVKYRDGSAARMSAGTPSSATDAVHRFGVGVASVRTLSGGAKVLRLDRRLDVTRIHQMAADLRSADPNVLYAEPDHILYPAQVDPNDFPNDTRAPEQWDFYDDTVGIQVREAWRQIRGSIDRTQGAGRGSVVGVIDTGYRPHPDLAPNLAGGRDFIADPGTAQDGDGRDSDATDPGDHAPANACWPGSPARSSTWHGTHVAGTIAAVTYNGTGVTGVAYNARVNPIRVLGRCGGATSDIAEAIIWASGGTLASMPVNPQPARIVNLSLGGYTPCSAAMQEAIDSARARGTVVIAAAGNNATDASAFQPANCAGVVTVAATSRTGGRASYSNFGTTVDLAAPGGESHEWILSTSNTGTTTPVADGYGGLWGTSMATPHVAGVAAMMLAVNASLTPNQVESLLKTTTRPFPSACSQCGTGLLDAAAAVTAAIDHGRVTIQEAEPNNTFATAQPIHVNSARIDGGAYEDGAGGYDVYSIVLGAGASLSLRLTSEGDNQNDLIVYSAAGMEVARGTAALDHPDLLVVRNGGSAATYYVVVDQWTGPNGPYVLDIARSH